MSNDNMKKNSVTINNGFIGTLQSEEVSQLANEGLVLYSTTKSLSFNPLVLTQQDGCLLVTPQDHIPENKLVALFSEDSFAPAVSFSFDEDAISSLLKDEPEYLCDIVALLEQNDTIDSKKMVGLLSALVKEGFSLCHILQVLDSLARHELTKLFLIYEEVPSSLRRSFAKLLASHLDEEDDEYY